VFPFIPIPFARRFEKLFITASFEELYTYIYICSKTQWIPIYSDCLFYFTNPNTLIPPFQAQSPKPHRSSARTARWRWRLGLRTFQICIFLTYIPFRKHLTCASSTDSLPQRIQCCSLVPLISNCVQQCNNWLWNSARITKQYQINTKPDRKPC